jgi:hypothetical protein
VQVATNEFKEEDFAENLNIKEENQGKSRTQNDTDYN